MKKRFRTVFVGTLFAAMLLPLPLFAATPENTVAGVCLARPWASGIISFLLPDGIFDGLCSLWGFGTVKSNVAANVSDTFNTVALGRGITCPSYAAPNVPANISWSCGKNATLEAVAGFELPNRSITRMSVVPTEASQVYGIRCSDGYESLCTVRTINPSISIWAEPETVRLGSRTNIFWSAEDVLNCRVIGPSFEEVGVRGGASTVPITAVAVFTARCETEAGELIDDAVVVDFER